MALQLKTPWWLSKMRPVPRVTIGLLSGGTVNNMTSPQAQGDTLVNSPRDEYSFFPNGGNYPTTDNYRSWP